MRDDSIFRLIVMINLAIAVPIGLYHRIKSQATGEKLARQQEGLFIMIALRLGGLLAWTALAAYLINPASMAWSSVALPAWLRWLGAILGVFVVPPLVYWTFQSLGNNLTDTVVTRRVHTLVTRGPYHWVRHPFYDVGFLWMLALSLLTANWLMALLGTGVIALLVVRTRVEEQKLLERFGDEYRAYAGRTGKFLPRLR
jgi:protein-S-isoprenylcysteine O-methyltransferase Ste14